MKQLFFKTITLLLLAILFTNCEKDDSIIQVQNLEVADANHISTRYVSGEKIPDIISLLSFDNNASLKSSNSNSIAVPFGAISIKNVLAITDTLGNQNYSFALIPKTPKPNSIFNLVVSTVKGGQEIAIMEYRMAPSFAEDYRKGNVTLETFTGSILKHPFTAANTKLFAKGDTCQDEAINCAVTNVSNGNVVNSYGGNSEGASTINTGNTNTFTGANGADITHNYGGPTTGGHQGTLITVVYADNCSCPGGGSRGDESRIVYIKITPLKHTNKSGITKKGENCCDNTNIGGAIGINLLSNQVNSITNCITDLTNEQLNFLNSSLYSFTIKKYLENNKNPNGTCNREANEFVKSAIEVLIAFPDANPFLGADCRSFEYAKPPGALQRGCAVKDFDHRFYTAGVRPNGNTYAGTIDIPIDRIYFTMPNWMTNGRAANLTAAAVTGAIKATDIHFFENPDITKFRLASFFEKQLKTQMALAGGSFSTSKPPFPIPHPAPYITSILGLSNPFDCE